MAKLNNLNCKLSLKNSLKVNNNQFGINNINKFKPNDIYLMQVCGNAKKSVASVNKIDFKIACLNSEQVIGIYDGDLNERACINDAHPETIINEIEYFKLDNNLLLTCGDDSFVKCWDLRNTRKSVLKYQGTNENGGVVKFLSCDIDCADQIIAASTSNNEDNNSFIYLFDIKMSNKILEKYEGAHSNDITQVKFDSLNKNRLVSASIDGLACVFDLLNLKIKNKGVASSDTSDDSFDDDDDLIDQVYNTTSSVQKIGYLNSNNQYLYAITFTNDLFVWNMNTQDEVLKFSLYNSKKDSDYIIDCFNPLSDPNEMIACLGDKNGNLQLYNSKMDLIFNTSSAKDETNNKHHHDLIRSTFWNYYHSELFSIGEDGILNKWKLDLFEDENPTNEDKACCSKKRSKQDNDNDDDNNNDDDDDDSSDDNKQIKKRKLYSSKNNKNFSSKTKRNK